MKKWVILQREKNKPKTIWEYFETKEDARKDSHVMEIIERYSESYPINEILPMAVNDVGGSCRQVSTDLQMVYFKIFDSFQQFLWTFFVKNDRIL